MEVTRASAEFSGGKAEFRYLMAPLGKKSEPARAVFDVNYRDVDLNALTEFYEMRGLQLAGRASGHNEMSWPLGRYAERTRVRHRHVRIDRRPAGPATARRTRPPTRATGT